MLHEHLTGQVVQKCGLTLLNFMKMQLNVITQETIKFITDEKNNNKVTVESFFLHYYGE